MGQCAVIELDGGSVVVICSKPFEPFDEGVFSSVGVDHRQFDLVTLKSRMYCRPVFVGPDNFVVLIDVGGIASSRYSGFKFEKLNRPIFPLDFDLSYAKACAVSRRALELGALAPIVTESFVTREGEFDFSVLVVKSLRHKPKAESHKVIVDPFDPPDEHLLLADSKLPNHFLVLNKFPVIEG